MKKAFVIMCVCVMFFLSGCSDSVDSNEEMLQVLKEEADIAAAISECAIVRNDNKILVVGVTGTNEQTQEYYAAEFLERKKDEYVFLRNVPLTECGWQNRVCYFGTGKVFICNNIDARSFEGIIKERGRETKKINVKITDIPWSYFLDLSDVNNSYESSFYFVDKNGETIY